jgi:dihydroorotate dehydrogenase
VQIGTANFADPFVWTKILGGLTDYMQRHSVARVTDLVGNVDTSRRQAVHA